MKFGIRRATVINIKEELANGYKLQGKFATDPAHFETFDLVYRSLCAMMFNYVPGSGHPGGSISSGRFVQSIIFNSMDYNFSNPDEPSADLISYAAGHKALGLYAMWALRNEVMRIAKPDLLPKDEKKQFRLEDLLGFRRNPVTSTPLFKKYKSKALDGHPSPATPFIKLSTGASGVGIATSFGMALGAIDFYKNNSPKIHVVEGEGGMTAGRVSESLAAAATMGLSNLILHVDWNQASIDSDNVCRKDDMPGDYVQWDPIEFCYLHDWNVILVEDGFDFNQIFAAQQKALEIDNGQPTAIVYKTIKGWKYGIEGRASHGGGHKLCDPGFYKAIEPLVKSLEDKLPTCDMESMKCNKGSNAVQVEQCYFAALNVIRCALEKNKDAVNLLANKTEDSYKRLQNLKRDSEKNPTNIETIFDSSKFNPNNTPDELKLEHGKSTTLRGALGNVLNYYNKKSNGAILAGAADLYGSTSIANVNKDIGKGFFHSKNNPTSRLLSIGGICEDAISGFMAGLSSYGRHIGVASSYAAFIAALGHIATRLHCIAGQAKKEINPNEPYKTYILTCAHAGLKTGEDGPTHADPQALQLLMENFPKGTMITLTPWDPQEIWPILTCALQKRPAVIAPFVTRPNEKIYDRARLGLSQVTDCTTGIYALRKADSSKDCDGSIVLQGSGVTYEFIEKALPKLDKQGVNLNIYYITSAELFDLLSETEQEKIYPASIANQAMGITGFTFPTMYRFITSEHGRKSTLHPFMKGHYLGSGQADKVLEQAGLDGESQFKAVMEYIK